MTEVRAGQRVQIEGRSEVFVVLQVDRERELADLLGEGAVRKVEPGIPLGLMRPLEETNGISDVKVPA